MEASEDAAKVKERVERLLIWYAHGTLGADGSAIVDLTELYNRATMVRGMIDELLRVPLDEPSRREEVGKRLGRLVAETQNLGWIARDLHEPLDRITYGTRKADG